MTAFEFNHQLSQLRGTLELFTLRFTNNAEEGQDLVQDTYLKALTYRERFIENTNLKGWLYTIMKNIFINNYRKQKRSKTTLDNTENLYHLNVPEKHTFNLPDSSLEYSQLMSSVEKTKEDFLVPFKMYLEGYKYHEISEKLNIPIGTVKTRIFYARKDIQERLEKV